MFPYANFPTSFIPFETFPSQMYPHTDLSTALVSMGNYCYFPSLQYFHQNFPLGQFSPSTLFPEGKSHTFKPFQAE